MFFFINNWLDLIIIILAILSLLEGIKRGFINEIFSLLSFIVSLIAASRFYSLLGNFFTIQLKILKSIAICLSFLMIGFIFETALIFLFYFIGKFLKNNFKINTIPYREKLNFINHATGGIPAFLSFLLILSFVLTTVITLPIRGDIKKVILNSTLSNLVIDNPVGPQINVTNIFASAIQDSLTFLTIDPKSHESVNLGFTLNKFKADLLSEEKMWGKINNERSKIGLGLLTLDKEKLREAARIHGEDMFQRGYFAHISPDGDNPFDRLAKLGINYLTAGENLAFAPSVDLAHDGLMNSPGHRANILNPAYKKVGIGVIDGGVFGEMFVQEFTD